MIHRRTLRRPMSATRQVVGRWISESDAETEPPKRTAEASDASEDRPSDALASDGYSTAGSEQRRTRRAHCRPSDGVVGRVRRCVRRSRKPCPESSLHGKRGELVPNSPKPIQTFPTRDDCLSGGSRVERELKQPESPKSSPSIGLNRGDSRWRSKRDFFHEIVRFTRFKGS